MKFKVPVLFSVKQANKAIMSFAQALGRANRGIGRIGLCYKLSALQNNLKSAYRYQLPKSTISGHLKDCFGFLCYKRHDRFDEFVDAFCKSLGEAMPYLKHRF